MALFKQLSIDRSRCSQRSLAFANAGEGGDYRQTAGWAVSPIGCEVDLAATFAKRVAPDPMVTEIIHNSRIRHPSYG
jgi:hypothetical protein